MPEFSTIAALVRRTHRVFGELRKALGQERVALWLVKAQSVLLGPLLVELGPVVGGSG
jgi:hypothetical protein